MCLTLDVPRSVLASLLFWILALSVAVAAADQQKRSLPMQDNAEKDSAWLLAKLRNSLIPEEKEAISPTARWMMSIPPRSWRTRSPPSAPTTPELSAVPSTDRVRAVDENMSLQSLPTSYSPRQGSGSTPVGIYFGSTRSAGSCRNGLFWICRECAETCT